MGRVDFAATRCGLALESTCHTHGFDKPAVANMAILLVPDALFTTPTGHSVRYTYELHQRRHGKLMLLLEAL